MARCLGSNPFSPLTPLVSQSIKPYSIQSMFAPDSFTVRRPSDAVDTIHCNPLRGTVDVIFSNGLRYEYDNVSRRSILNLLVQPNLSLGFWVNDNCLSVA